MRQIKIKELYDFTTKEIIKYVESASKRYKYVVDESSLSETELVENNLLFVVSVAKQYVNQGIPLEDLIQYGNLGLIAASKNYDATKGFRFISYAVSYIRAEILKALNSEKSLITLPLNVRIKLVKINRIVNAYVVETGEYPSIEVLTNILDIPKKYAELYYFDYSFFSTDTGLVVQGEQTGVTFYDVFAGDSLTQDWINDEHNKYLVEKLISILPERDQEIIKLYYLENVPIDVISSKYSLSRERVRQICIRSLTYMKHGTRLRKNKARDRISRRTA